MKLRLRQLLISLAILLLASVSMTLSTPQKASAVTGADWKPGRIIDDAVFFNKNTMSVGQIQAFLNAKVPVCAKNHSDYSPTYPGPYTCLKDYQENTGTGESNVGRYNGDGSPYQVPGGKSSAQIIWDAAQAYSINPQTLLVMLQKEQSLVTDDWPLIIQYQKAMGQSCPDTAPCDPAFAGFYRQVSGAAWQFRYYIDHPNSFNYKAGVTRYVLYNPDTSCSGTNVFIENNATAALYNYTPYQPNAGALNNLYGSALCGAYGNRNFWRLFNDWFGSTSSLLGDVTMTNIQQPDPSPAVGQTVAYTFSLTNNSSLAVTIDAVGVVGRPGSLSGPNRDFGWVGPATIQPTATQQFTFTTVIRDVGTIYAWPAVYYQGNYIHYNNWGALLNSHVPNISLVSPLVTSVSNPVVGQVATLSATIKNNEDQPIKLDSVGIPVRFYNTYNYDIPWTATATIQPNTEQIVSGNITFDKPGPYTAWVSSFIASKFTTLSTALNLVVAKAVPNFLLTYIETPNPTPAVGESVVLKFKLKNNSGVAMTLNAVGVVGRNDSPYAGPNRDFGWVGPETFGDGEEKSYTSFSRNISELNKSYAWVAINYNNTYIHYNNWGFLITPH